MKISLKCIPVVFFIKSILLLILMQPYTTVLAQSYHYTQYKTAQGLAGDIVYAITQDSEGFLWFGTETGVSRFDGTTFQNFTIADGLPDNTAYRILADSKGRVWFVPFKHSISYYYKGRIHTPENDPLLRQLKFTGIIKSIFEDDQHNIAILTNCELYIISADNKVTILNDTPWCKCYFTILGMNEHNKINTLCPNGIFQISDRQLVYKQSLQGNYRFYAAQMDIRGNNLYWHTDTILYIKRNQIIKEITIPSLNNYQLFNDSLIYINTTQGNYLLNVNTLHKEQSYLTDKNISTCFRDNEGSMWFATQGEGAFRLHSQQFQSLQYTVDNRPLKVFSLFDNGNNLLVGTEDACLRLDLYPRKQLTKEVPVKLSWPVSLIYKNGSTLYLLIKYGLLARHNNTNYEKVNYAFATKKMMARGDDLLIANSYSLHKTTAVGYLNHHHGKELYNGRTTTLWVDQDSIFFGTPNGPYQLINDSVLIFLGKISPYLKDRVTDICKTTNGILWIGTSGNGVTGLKNGKPLFHMNVNNGITSNAIRCMTPDNDGSLWVGTDKGLDRLSIVKDSIHIISYTAAKGLLSNWINAIVIKGDTVFVGSPEGLTFFDKRKQDFSSRCNLRITGISASGKPVSRNNLLELTYGNNQLRFDYTAISFKSAGDIRYMYRLKGLDTSWMMTRQRQLEFIALSPGEYELELYAINHFLLKSEIIRIPIRIGPRFWQTSWFNIALILSIILLTWGVIAWINKLSNRKKTVQLQMERRLQDLEQKALRAQMNPHFIFNCLHAIQGYIIDRDIHSANHYLSSFAKLIRQTLDNSLQTMIPVAEEITYLTTYLNLECLRFEDTFLFHFHIDEHIDKTSTLLPSMMLQPYVENAIRHGIQNKTNGQGVIDIHFMQRDQFLICIVEDNGVGRAAARLYRTAQHIEYQSRGMQLTEERIALLSNSLGIPIEIDITDICDKSTNITGTRVRVKLPLLYTR